MPAGVSMGRYLTFTTAAILSMFAGSQAVHLVYRPLDDLPELVDKYYAEHPEIKKPSPDPYQEALELNIKDKLTKTTEQ